MAEQSHVIMIIKGRVQGVYFRNFVQKQAQALVLNGFVRNLPDITKVEVQAEGNRDKLELLLDTVKVGPPGAKVEKVETIWSQYNGIFKAFEIK
ncbi:MAG: acylphosphatase-like protein [Dehalococcoidia bacterium]|nr:acylphosphatase-like protein [Dehalococcoidia bacterium]